VEPDDLSTRVWRGRAASVAQAVVPTGFSELDRFLPGGGWPVGALTEVFLARYGIGELSLLMPAMAALTSPERARKWVAWVAPPFVPYAPALRQHGVDIERLLMIHPTPSRHERCWAVEQVVRSGSSVGVLAWLAAIESVALRRLQLAAELAECWLVLFRPESASAERSPAALRLRLTRSAAMVRLDVIKCRGGRPGVIDGLSLDRRSAPEPAIE
jgi:protein ImuA